MNSSDHFEALVGEHYQALFRFAMSLTHSEPDALDLTQHTFYVWAAKGHQLRDVSKVKTWLFTTLHRAFLEGQRRQKRFPHHELEEEPGQLPAVPPQQARRADCAQVLPALAGVDEIYRAAVALFYLEDCPYKDIAEILGIPLGTVKSRIARGIEQLREILSDGPGVPPPNGNARNFPAASEGAPSFSRGDRLPASECPETHYDEWDFSSTLVAEHFGAA